MNAQDANAKNSQIAVQKAGPKDEKACGPGRQPTQETSKFSPLLENIGQGLKGQKKKDETRSSRVLVAKKEKQKPESFINLVDIALDSYDDIFSDFDSSPYSRRTLSIDFIKEVERRYGTTKEGNLRLVFSLPKKMRNSKEEAVIKDRMREYFAHQIKEIEDEAREEQKFGIMLIGGGIVFIILSNLIGAYGESSFLLKTIHEITLIPGWVGEFLGVEKILFSTKKSKEKERLYKKLRDASYVFVSTEDVVKKMSESISQKSEKGEVREVQQKAKDPQPDT